MSNHRRLASVAISVGIGAVLLSSCSSSNGQPSDAHRAVVIMSGGAAISPFTTPDAACRSGLTAGNTNSALRDFLLAQGYAVYTAPAMAGPGPVKEQGGFGAFGQCPPPLPGELTVDSTGDIDAAGANLSAFLGYLSTNYGVTTVDLIGHSMGGLFARSAIRQIRSSGSDLTIRSLTTLSSSWQSSFIDEFGSGHLTAVECGGDGFCARMAVALGFATQEQIDAIVVQPGPTPLEQRMTWNLAQAGALDGIPVTLIGGTHYSEAGTPLVWPNDGIVALSSSLAVNVPDSVLPHRRCISVPDTHSIFVSDAFDLSWDTAITWDPRVLQMVADALDQADSALSAPNRQGCPASVASNGLITATTPTDEGFQLATMNVDGSDLTQITDAPLTAAHPAWSPDGSRVAYSVLDDKVAGIWVANADGSDPRKVTPPDVYALVPWWSPDGSHIAFESNLDGNFEIYTMKADGSELTQVTQTEAPTQNFGPKYSPDGSTLLYSSNQAKPQDPNADDLWLINTDGTAAQQITFGFDNAESRSWSPLGDHIVFNAVIKGVGQLFTLDMTRPNTEPVQITQNPGIGTPVNVGPPFPILNGDVTPVWSPDGTRIVFASNRDGNLEIYTVRPDGTDLTQVTTGDGMFVSLGWQPLR